MSLLEFWVRDSIAGGGRASSRLAVVMQPFT